MFSFHYREVIGNIKEPEGKKCFIVDDNMLDNVLDKIKEIIGLKNLITLRF